jgi:hypothetical protein
VILISSWDKAGKEGVKYTLALLTYIAYTVMTLRLRLVSEIDHWSHSFVATLSLRLRNTFSICLCNHQTSLSYP